MAQVGRLVLYAALALASVCFLVPLYLLLVTSLKPFAEAGLEQMWSLPGSLSLASVFEAWAGNPIVGEPGLANSFVNSLQIVVPGALVSTLIGSINGYVLSRWKFRGDNFILLLLLFSLFVPYQTVLIPLVQLLQWLNLYGTIPGLILVHVVYGIPVTTLLLRSFYARVPGELFEAAEMDGASLFGIYRWVLLPVSIPGFVVALVWQFASIWNDYVLAAAVTTPATEPMTVTLNGMAGSFIVQWNVQLAGALLVALPPLALYVLLGRFIIGGFWAGSVDN